MYLLVLDANGAIVKDSGQLEGEVEAALTAAMIDPFLAKAIAAEGAKPGYPGNDLHAIAISGQLHAANGENFHALIRRDVAPTLATGIATEATGGNYDSVLLRDLANNDLLNASTVIDITALGPPAGPLTYSWPQLQKKYHTHGGALGFSGPPNNANVVAFQQAIEAHVRSPNVVEFPGTYRAIAVLILLDPVANLMVIAKPSRDFISVWCNTPAKQTYARYLGRI